MLLLMLRINLAPSDIEAFLSVADTASFSRSAVALGLSQPAVSARIQHLERVLGIPLFHRTTRQVVITDAGERLRVRLEHTMAELRGLLQEFEDETRLRRGRITLGASPTVAASFLPDIISRFHAERPEIEIILHDDFYGRALDRLLRGEVDLAVLPFEHDNELFDFEPLCIDRFHLAVPSGHKLAAQHVVTLRQIAHETLISMPPESSAWGTFKRAFTGAGLEFTPALQTRNALTELAMIRAGFGIGYVTELMANTLDLKGIVLLTVEGADLTRRVGIVRSKARSLSPAATAFRLALRAAMPLTS
jgi:LysR family transcriptional regulator, carnitine catabolism transcriptional activator